MRGLSRERTADTVGADAAGRPADASRTSKFVSKTRLTRKMSSFEEDVLHLSGAVTSRTASDLNAIIPVSERSQHSVATHLMPCWPGPTSVDWKEKHKRIISAASLGRPVLRPDRDSRWKSYVPPARLHSPDHSLIQTETGLPPSPPSSRESRTTGREENCMESQAVVEVVIEAYVSTQKGRTAGQCCALLRPPWACPLPSSRLREVRNARLVSESIDFF